MGGLFFPPVTIGNPVVAGTPGNLLFVGTGPILAQTPKITLPQPDVAGQGPTIAAGIATTNVNALNISHEWNNAAIAFRAIRVSVTNTNSADAYVQEWLVNGSSVLGIDKTGRIRAAGLSAILDLKGGPGLVYGNALGNYFYVGLGNGLGVTIKPGTATTNVNALSVSQTWNNAAVAFTGVKISITDLASAAASVAFQLLGGADGVTNLFSVNKNGITTSAAAIFNGTTFANLPAIPSVGLIANVTDSNTAVWGAIIAGGGANNVLARYNGVNWTVVGI